MSRGWACWVGVLSMMLGGAALRALAGGVALDSALVLAAVSAIPAAVGAMSGARGGFWCGFFGVYGILAVLFPSVLAEELAIGPAAGGAVWLLAAVSAGLIGAAGSRGSGWAAAACGLWLVVSAAADAAGTTSLMFAGAVLVAASTSSLAAGVGAQRAHSKR